MALLTCHFFSEVLEESTSVTVLLPQATRSQIGLVGVASDEPPPVLYLLHGLSDDETIWTRRTSVERYAAESGLAVVMPRVGRSMYADQHHGAAYWTFLSQELPERVAEFFRVSQRREDSFVAGLSMGGYGAFKWALREPHRFAAAASLSGALDVGTDVNVRSAVPQVWGDGPIPAGDDLLALLDAADPASLPDLFVACGTEDFLFEQNLRFLARADERGVPVRRDVERPGEHEWGYWDARIAEVIDWLPISR